MNNEELDLLLDLCDAYARMGMMLRMRLRAVVDGDRLDKHQDVALREIGGWLQQAVVFLDDKELVNNLIDDIEMYLFGEYLEDNGYE